VLAGKGEDVGAAGRLEGIRLLGGETVPDSEDQSLHQSGRALSDPGERLPEGAAKTAPQAIDAPTLVEQLEVARLREERWAADYGAAIGRPARRGGPRGGRGKGPARPNQGARVDLRTQARENSQHAAMAVSRIGNLRRYPFARQPEAFDSKRIRAETIFRRAGVRGETTFRPDRPEGDETLPRPDAAIFRGAAMGQSARFVPRDCGSRGEAESQGDSLHAPEARRSATHPSDDVAEGGQSGRDDQRWSEKAGARVETEGHTKGGCDGQGKSPRY
jgi:hypothetical protein